jgi:hypothetical protein
VTAPEAVFGRIPLVVVEIDQEVCANTYGTAPCTAALGVTGTDKCFNTRASCQDPTNYAASATPLTLKFCQSHADLPEGEYLIPSVKSVTTSPTRINPGGRTGRDKPLGRRGECTVSFIDHPHSDNLVDPYVSGRSYNPLERSTFWAKWLKRNPYHANWSMRVREGYVGQALADMQVRNYVVDKIEGPDSSGNVSLKGVDILRLADNDKAQCPALSNGKLLADITAAATSLTVTGGTLAEYTAYSTNAIRIENEIIRYTSVTTDANGDLAFTGLTRGQDGSTAADHSSEDTVQACIEWTSAAPWLVAKTLLVDFGAVPTAWIPYTDWETEAGTWLSGLVVSRLLSKPIGVTDLLGELQEQCMFYIWWDERAQQVKFRAVKPVSGTVPLITEDFNLVQNGTSIKVHPEYRASEVWVSFLQRNAAEDPKKRENFRRTNARIDSENLYGERRVYEIFSPWLQTQAHVDQLTYRLLARYRHPPRYVNFSLDPKDRSLGVGDVFDLEYRGFCDFTGQAERVRYQVISAHEPSPGASIKIEAQKYDFDADVKYGYWMVDTAPVYADATEEQRFFGMWWADDSGKLSDGSDGYVWG